jgi:hypothetical protein
MVVGAANAPVFIMLDTLVGQGSVGGNVISYAAQGRIAAQDVMKILGGAKPQNIPIVKGPNVYLFDGRALRPWDLKERNLPAESIVLNRQPALRDAYGQYVFGALLLLFVLLLLIFALLRERAKERSIKHTGLRSRSSGCAPAFELMNNRLVRCDMVCTLTTGRDLLGSSSW